MLKHKIKEWVKRYLPGELVGTVTAIGAATIAHLFSQNYILIAYAGSLGEALGFYSTFIIQQILLAAKKHKNDNTFISFSDFPKIIAKIVLEFGLAGIIDGLFLRPFFMYLFPVLLENFTLGILTGKIAGDITFYMLVILSYELAKWHKKTNNIK
jgi:O-antigen/teichoic acid export membrane protein